MGRPHLSIMGVIYEALGFATSKFSTALRVAWLPLILIMLLQVVFSKLGLMPEGQALALKVSLEPGWVTRAFLVLIQLPFEMLQTNIGGLSPLQHKSVIAGMVIIAAILQASILVPLIRYASTGEAPHHRSMHLDFSKTHLQFVGAAILSYGAVMTVMGAAYKTVQQGFLDHVIPILNKKSVTLDTGTLHPDFIEVTEGFQGLRTVVSALDGFLRDLGLQLSSIDVMLIAPFALISLYVILRLLAWPYLVAGGSDSPFKRSLSLSGGANIFGLLMVVVLWVVLSTGTLWVTAYALRYIFTMLTAGTEYMLSGYQGFLPETDASAWLRGGLVVMFGAILVAIQTFLVAFQAGIGGALVHRARG